MNRNQKIVLIVGVIILSIVRTLDAVEHKSIRCKGGIVTLGDSKLTVQGKCGPPTLSELTGASGSRSSISLEDTWEYDCGKNSFTRQFTFSRGRLVNISTGGYGFGDSSCE
jgi:hypothetical protein